MTLIKEFSRSSRFSYQCNRCARCCIGRQISLNPYEICRLAQNKGLSTTKFIADYINVETMSLRHHPDGSCLLLTESQCGVYEDRPLACRLYPLGRRKSVSGAETFEAIPPDPQTKGIYSDTGTVGDFLHQQEVNSHLLFADRYLHFYAKLLEYFLQKDPPTIHDLIIENFPVLYQLRANKTRLSLLNPTFDIDKTLKLFCEKNKVTTPETIEERALLHLQALENWLEELKNA